MNSRYRWFLLLPALCVPASSFPAAGQEPATAAKILTLREAVGLALSRGTEVLLAVSEAAKAGDALREARSALQPQVVTGTGLAYNNGFPLSIEGSAPSIVQVGLSQSIFSRKDRNLIREAEAGSAASLAGSDAARNGLAAKTALLYAELHHARMLVPLLKRQYETAEANRQRMEDRVQAGRARPVDLTMARLSAEGIRQQVRVAEERARIAEMGLREITGLQADGPIATEPPVLPGNALAEPQEILFQNALKQHPEIREAEALLRAREFHAEAERAERYPQFTIVSQYALFSKANNYEDYFNRFSRNNYLLGLSVQVPLFNGNRTDARVAESRREAEGARLRLDRMKSDVRLGLERSAGELQIAAGAAELARLEVAACEEKLKVSEALGEAGRIEPAEVDSTRAQLLEKQVARVEAERILFERQVALLQAGGSLAAVF